MKSKKTWKRLLSVLLTVSIVITTIAPSTAVSAAENSSTEISVSTQDDDSTPKTTVSSDDVETSNADKTEDAQETSKASLEQSQSQQADNDKTEDASTKAATDTNLYQNGSICIYNEQQLKAIGTETQVHGGDTSADTFGTGAALTDEDGNTLTYAVDGSYTLMNDIPLTKESIWTLPEGFTGSFQGAEITAEKPLYDAETDTIYVYNNYQLATINDPDAIKTVMSNDMIASEFGVGQVVYTDEEKKTQLEYTADHNYVLSKDFTEQMPEMKAAQVQAEVTDEQLDGRSYIGQVIFNETDAEKNTKQYILIGNKQQLEAIGKTDKDGKPIKVTEPVWRQHQKWNGAAWVDDEAPQLIYAGDADIEEGVLLYDNPDANNQEIGKDLEDVGLFNRNIYRGSKKKVLDNKTTYEYDVEAEKYINMERLPGDDSDPAYTTWANYIIFRDIDLKNNERNPIMFSGTMEGRKDMESGQGITISNINVKPATIEEGSIFDKKDKLDTSKNIGIGFFGTITNQPDANNFGISGGTASVKNITLSQISVSNTMTEAAEGETLISGLLGVVGGLLGAVGGILDGLLGWIGDLIGSALGNKEIFDGVSLKKLLTNLLDVRKTASDTFATGGFAGRIIGDVEVTGCHVEGLTISNVKDMTGGFVGNVEGLTEYDGLSKTLEGTVDVLTGILNVIPGLGLGDLITVLIGTDGNGLVHLDQLIPTRYIQAQIKNCSVDVNSIENNNGKYVGGFAGMQTGSSISDCTVSNLQKVTATKYAGGFTGVTRDAIVKGLLESLDADLVPHLNKLNPSSNIVGCKVEGTGLIIQSTGKYAGGFTGMAGNSNLSNSSVSGLTSVTAIDNYAGGFAGRATLGSGIIMAGEEEGDIQETGLLGTATNLLKTVLAGDCDTQLLNLVGISATEMEGCSVSGTNFEIEAAQYAGGLIGQGDGVIIRAFVSNNSETESTSTANNIDGIGAVSATNYAGGVAGQMLPANGSGVLDGVFSIANVLPFSLENINVIARENGFAITTDEEYAGGAIGQATGGTIEQVTLTNIKQVTAKNYAGGFVGYAGPGSILESGGLNILGLVKINSLLQVGEMLETQIKTCKVQGKDLQVSATGNVAGKSYFAGGFIGENSSSKIQDSSVTELKKVSTELKTIEFDNEENMTASYAGGFAARSQVGGLADVGDSDTVDGLLGGEGVVSIDGLLDAVGYLIPEYTNCYVKFTDSDGTEAQVNSAISGGFIGEMQGGIIDNTTLGDKYAVRNVKYIEGTYYAGGLAGKVLSGGLAQSNGLSLLGTDIDVEGLLNLIPTYIPKIKTADVQSGNNGLKVYATSSIDTDVDSGTAGGYVGLARGANISNSDVSELATKTSEEEPGTNDYAVQAPVYAGGYVGKADIGSAAAVGKSLSVLEIAEIGELTSAIAAVESKFESCNVYGKTGGFNVKSSEGNAGGYAGIIEGSNFNDSNSYNFEYIEGVVSAGGYAGTIQPGDVAKLVGTADVLKGLVSVDNLLGVAKTFIPRIWNSETTAVPCGGYIKATGESSDATKRGLAGGYVGYNLGGQIQGNKEEIIIEGNTPETRTASAIRIRSVYGTEYAGGYTGLMESANIADTGSFKLLYGLIKLKTPLTAVQAIYATEENTAVYGPLTYVDVNDWNGWVTYVGSKGPYAEEFAGKTFDNQSQLGEFLKDYAYGYDVTAGRNSVATEAVQGGAAGGYVGRMEGGTITNATAEGLKSVNAFRSSGGFAGEMITGDVAEVGGIELAGIDILDSLPVLKTFVPVIKNSTVNGYQSGAIIKSQGIAEIDPETKKADPAGIAGGYVGRMIGGQIWGTEGDEFSVTGLRQVDGTSYAGGYAGKIDPGSAATVDTASSQGLLNKVLKYLIGTDGSLAEVLNATVSTIRYAKVSAWDEYGIVVNAGKDSKAAGGFAGAIQGAVLGDENKTAGLQVNKIRSVTGGEHAGGFFGLADVAAVAEVSGKGNTTILSLIKAGSIDLIDAFRTYIYNADVIGSTDGLTVTALKGEQQGSGESIVYTGNAGGFGGSLLNGSVKGSSVTNLKSVKAPNYTGGFIGHGGKSGTVDADGTTIEGLLGVDAGVLDVFGSNIDKCSVAGLEEGYTVQSTNGTEEIAGGFIGNADLSRMSANTAENLKQVYSDEIAGGFVGKTSMAYLIRANVDSPLVDTILQVVNELIKALYIDDLQESNLVDINLPGLLKVELFNGGKTLGVTLLGLKITVALSKAAEEGETDVAIITIGDSEIRLNCTKDGIIDSDDAEGAIANSGGLEINLIKANRTKIEKSSVIGIPVGYDVFGAGASNDKDGKSNEGYTGGFVGYNDAGLLEGNKMEKADTIRGFAGQIGEFSGYTDTNTSYDALEDPTNIEKANTYQVYRTTDKRFTVVKKINTIISQTGIPAEGSDPTGEVTYTIKHLDVVKTHNDWQDVYMTTNTETSYVKVPIKVYVSDAQADLMYGVETYISTGDETAKPGEMQDPCDETVNITIQKVWKDNDNSVGEDHKRPRSIKVEVYRLGQNTEEEKVGDYNITGDASSNVWSVTIPELPAVYEENGTYKNYTYTVKEVGSQEEYITEYTKDENGYNYVITNTHTSTLVEGDSVVIDFGLPVKVNVLANDAIQGSGTLTGVSKGVLDNIYKVLDSDVTEELNKDNKDEEGWTKGYFGRATVVDGTITYEPTTMEMNSFDQFTYSVETKTNTVNGADGSDCYIYSTLTVIPATTIYYEDNVSMITYTNADKSTYKGEILNSEPVFGNWYTVENESNEFKPAENQDTDRPGLLKPGEEQIEDDADNMYGYDSNYTSKELSDTSRTKYSNGSSKFVRVAKGKTPTATFTFSGTGFDLISLTSNETGVIRVKVVNQKTGKAVKSWTVDTYYGYTAVKNEDGSITWKEIESEEESSLYQIPVIRAKDLEYGTYQVTVTPSYAKTFDHDDDGSYDFYLDAVRVYAPANAEENAVIKEAYSQDGEYDPTYKEIRSIVIKNEAFEEPSTEVYIDGIPKATWSDYKEAGPSHELYLAKDQTIAFNLTVDQIPTSVRIGAKSIRNSVEFSVGFSVNEPTTDKDNWVTYNAKSITCNTATDLYYDITDQCVWKEVKDENGKVSYVTAYPITITNTSDSILSLTYLKWMSKAEQVTE